MVEILTKQDLEQAMIAFKQDFFSEMKKLINGKVADEWLQGREAMELLNCKQTKLSSLIADGLIVKRGQGKGSKYSRKSIMAYLEKL